MMSKMLLICFLLCGSLGLCLVRGDETLIRTEPSFNPFFVQVGAPFSMTCIKEASSRIPVAWYLDGGDPEDSGFSTKNGHEMLDNGMVRTYSHLTKDRISLEDIGDLGLICETDVSEDDKEDILVSVYFFNVLTEHPNITEGEDTSLRCAPDVTANIVWSRDGVVIDNTSSGRVLQDENRTLVIHNSKPQDSGIYQCKVLMLAGMDKNARESKEQTFIQNISVSGKPYLQEKMSANIDTLINDTLTLSCSVKAYPAPEVFWLREGDSPVQPSSRVTYDTYNGISDAVLKISSVTKEDLGTYHCVAKNSIGQMSKEFHVGLAAGVMSEHAYSGLLIISVGLFSVFLSNMNYE